MTHLPNIEFSKTVHDYNTMLQAVSLNGIALQYASDELKDNEIIVRQAMSTNCWAFMYASSRLKCNKELVMQAVEKNGAIISYCPYFSDDWDVALKAIKENGDSLKYVSDRLKNNKKLVLKALKDNMFALNHLSENLRNDKEVAIFCITKNENNLSHFSQEVKDIFKEGGIKQMSCMLYSELLNEKLQKYEKNQKPKIINKNIKI